MMDVKEKRKDVVTFWVYERKWAKIKEYACLVFSVRARFGV